MQAVSLIPERLTRSSNDAVVCSNQAPSPLTLMIPINLVDHSAE